MSPGVAVKSGASESRIASARSLRSLIQWASEQDAESTGRALWVPCQGLNGAVSTRAWVLHEAARMVGDSTALDPVTLLLGAADTIFLCEPSAADASSLNWLNNFLRAWNSGRKLLNLPPMPAITVLHSGAGRDTPELTALLKTLQSLGAREQKVSGKGSAASTRELKDEIHALASEMGRLLGALAVLPCPVQLDDFSRIARKCGRDESALSALTAGNLFAVAGGYVVPLAAEVQPLLIAELEPELLRQGADALSAWQDSLTDLPEARIQVMAWAGDGKKAARAARKVFDEHYDARRFEEALRVLRVLNRAGTNLESGKHAALADDACRAALQAATGETRPALEAVQRLARRREAFDDLAFVEWLGRAAAELAMRGMYPGRAADSLVRRGMRLIENDLDRHVRGILLRVTLLASRAFENDDRGDWLLSHINNEMLEQVTPATRAAYFHELATRHLPRDEYRAAFKRLRKVAASPVSSRMMASTMAMMARCRAYFADHEGASRYAIAAARFGVYSAEPDRINEATNLLAELERSKPRDLPSLAPSSRKAVNRPPAVDQFLPADQADTSQLFEILQGRFGVKRWVRRRGGSSTEHGRAPFAGAVRTVVLQEGPAGVSLVNSTGVTGGQTTLVLLRSDGSDLVSYESQADVEQHDESLARFLLADRASDAADATPKRKNVVEEFLSRAAAHGIKRGLHHTMEVMFTKDLLIYLEEQGLNKEDMAERLGVSRATLYRMFARAGLNR